MVWEYEALDQEKVQKMLEDVGLLAKQPKTNKSGLEGVMVDGFEIPAGGMLFDGYVSGQGEVPPDRVLRAGLGVGRKRILVPQARLNGAIRIFRLPTMEIQASVSDAIRTQGGDVIDLPSTPAEAQVFWKEFIPQSGDVILLDVQSGKEEQWLPADLGRGVAVLNLPHVVVAGMEVSELAAMVNAALAHGGPLRIKAVIQTDLEGIFALDVEA